MQVSSLSEPTLIETPSLDTLYQARKKALIEVNGAWAPALSQDSDPLTMRLKVEAYRSYCCASASMKSVKPFMLLPLGNI